MALPTEQSIFCEKCGCYNLQSTSCVILNGEVYCLSCFSKSSDLQNLLKELLHEEKHYT